MIEEIENDTSIEYTIDADHDSLFHLLIWKYVFSYIFLLKNMIGKNKALAEKLVPFCFLSISKIVSEL